MGQNEDPFQEKGALIPESDEAVYDFDDVHKWDNVIVKEIGKAEGRIITWGAANVASHRGVAGKSQKLQFSLDAKKYEDALLHPDLNRGVILMAGDPIFPSLHCWLRPFSVHDGKVIFILSIPVDRLGETYVAFIPRGEGKKRYLYKLVDVVRELKNTPDTHKEE